MNRSNLLCAEPKFLTRSRGAVRNCVSKPTNNAKCGRRDSPIFVDHRCARCPQKSGQSLSRLPNSGIFYLALAVVALVSIANLQLCASSAFAAEESCDCCGQQVSISGDFVHRKDSTSVAIEGVKVYCSVSRGNHRTKFHDQHRASACGQIYPCHRRSGNTGGQAGRKGV